MLLMKFSRSTASRRLIPGFARVYQINQEEMEKEIGEYGSLHDFFIRRLKPGRRIADQDPRALVSPVDAVLEDVGPIENGHLFQVKGKTYSVSEMLGSEEAAEGYMGGTYMVLYLSPTNYHRIHSPVTGSILKQWVLGKRSYPVNKLGLKYGREPLSKNYRMISEMGFDGGKLALIKVGAMFVNSIETVHKGDTLEKGEEMAYFSFGSTIVLLLPAGSVKLDEGLAVPKAVKVGERLGSF